MIVKYKRKPIYKAVERTKRNNGISNETMNPDTPSLTERKYVDRFEFKFHKILKDIVQREKEDILKDPGIADILRNYQYGDINPVVIDILGLMINDNVVDLILDHETNNWDNLLNEQINDYIQEYRPKYHEIVEGIARCVAYSVGMEVDLLPFNYIIDGRSNPRRKRRKIESEDDDWI